MKKVVIAGGTGFIGRYLTKRFRDNGYHVLIVSRDPEHVAWNLNDLVVALNGAELLVNLAGGTINCRHNEVNRKVILESRVKTTLSIGNALLACENPPKLWINASATGVYKPSDKYEMTEDETQLGVGFLSEVVREWEKAFFEFQLPKTRQVALRTAVVLGRNGGALQPLVKLTRFGLGGRQGDGKQKVSWIHIEDYFRVLMFLLENKSVNHVVNCCSPTPVSNNELMCTLRKRLHMSIGIPAPKLFVQLGARFLGTDPDLILSSSFVVPKRLKDAGFKFHYPTIDLALIDLVHSK